MLDDPDSRVAIFVDGSNFYHSLKKNRGRADINFEILAKSLCGPRKPVRI